MAAIAHSLDSPLELLDRFKKSPAELSLDELSTLFNWLAEDPERLHIGDHCDPSVAASQVKRLADLVGGLRRREQLQQVHCEA